MLNFHDRKKNVWISRHKFNYYNTKMFLVLKTQTYSNIKILKNILKQFTVLNIP